jgi:hypothetical protein
MDHGNKVEISLSRDTYLISLFSYSLKIDQSLNYIVNIDTQKQIPLNLSLSAVPLNVSNEDLEVITLEKIGDEFHLPRDSTTSDFIIISDGELQGEVMPRYVRTAKYIQIVSREDRMEKYHSELLNNSFEHDSWKQLIKYFKICKNYEIPFSTLDQLRSIVGSSMVASKAFLILGIEDEDKEEYIQNIVPKLEIDLGFRFHWVCRDDWKNAIYEIQKYISSQSWFFNLKDKGLISEQDIFNKLTNLILEHFTHNNLSDIKKYINYQKSQLIDQIGNQNLQRVRSLLGEKVLNQLPKNSPYTNDNYGIPVKNHKPIKLLINSPIAAAESIFGLKGEKSIWSCQDKSEIIRRNMQYAEILTPNLYKIILIYTLGKIK